MQGLVDKYLSSTQGADPQVKDHQATQKQVQVPPSLPSFTFKHMYVFRSKEI